MNGKVRYKRERKNENEEWYVYVDDKLAGSVVFDPKRGGWKPGREDSRLDPRATREEAAEALISWRRKRSERLKQRRARKRGVDPS